VTTYLDYWGTRVDTFGVRERHSSLTIVADSVVETSEPPAPDGPAPLETARSEETRSAHWQYLQPTIHTRWGPDLTRFADDLAGSSADVVEIARSVNVGVNQLLAYAPGTTYVGVDVNEVYAGRTGVCQDFVHVALAVYRSLGIPARYVSGYFYSSDQALGDAPTEAEIEGQTHAWIEVLIPGFGWWGLDPTNEQPAGMRHAKIGHGRDYDDVLPLRGVFHGSSDHRLAVSVRMSRDRMTAFLKPDRQQ
jgi:transglutaminase-like putative cysteine protease